MYSRNKKWIAVLLGLNAIALAVSFYLYFGIYTIEVTEPRGRIDSGVTEVSGRQYVYIILTAQGTEENIAPVLVQEKGDAGGVVITLAKGRNKELTPSGLLIPAYYFEQGINNVYLKKRSGNELLIKVKAQDKGLEIVR